MIVSQLQAILSQFNSNSEVFIEYSPRRHEYIKESLLAVRRDDEDVVFIGITEADE